MYRPRGFRRIVVAVLLIAVGLGLWVRDFSRPAATNSARSVNTALEVPPPSTITVPVAANKAESTDDSHVTVIDVCGMGKVTVDRDDLSAASQSIFRTDASIRNRWLSGMLQSGDPRIRATGLLLENKIGDEDFNKPRSVESVNSLVTSAVDSKDPWIYALAVQECMPRGVKSPGGACEQISLENWANMDRDNAVPWLALASKAHNSGDTTAEYAAYAQAAKAKVFNSDTLSLMSYAEPALPEDTTPLQRYTLLARLIGAESASPLGQVSALSRHCSVETASDETLRSQCSALAELLVTKASSLIEAMIGTSIGARMGWPEERLTALRDRYDAFKQVNLEVSAQLPQDMWSCNVIARGNEFTNAWARLGEMGALEERLARSEKPIPELAQEYRASVDLMMRQVQASVALKPSK